MKLRYPDLLYKEIDRVYRPKLDAKEQKAALYIGPLIDGLVKFGVFEDRAEAKSFLDDAKYGESHNRWRKAKLTIQRGGKKISLTKNITDAEPGEVLNSPVIDKDTSTVGDVKMVWNPIIREENRYKLHVLFKGDKITKWQSRGSRIGESKQPLEKTFILTDEGSSEITPEKSNDEVVY